MHLYGSPAVHKFFCKIEKGISNDGEYLNLDKSVKKDIVNRRANMKYLNKISP